MKNFLKFLFYGLVLEILKILHFCGENFFVNFFFFLIALEIPISHNCRMPIAFFQFCQLSFLFFSLHIFSFFIFCVSAKVILCVCNHRDHVVLLNHIKTYFINGFLMVLSFDANVLEAYFCFKQGWSF